MRVYKPPIDQEKYMDIRAQLQENLSGLKTIYADSVKTAAGWHYNSKEDLIKTINIISEMIAYHEVHIAEIDTAIARDNVMKTGEAFYATSE